VLALAAGCAVKPHPLTDADLTASATADRIAMFQDQAPLDKPLTLAEAIARVLRYNLDHRSKMMDEALALGQLDIDRWDLLPKLTAEAGYVGRTDHATVSSRDAVTLEPALSDPYYSLDRDRHVADLTVSWNVLDFGLGYYTAHQNADRALIAEERRRKAVQNLVQDVRAAYWRALAAQQLAEQVSKTIATADKALNAAGRVEDEQLRNPLDSLRYQKTLLETLRQLESIKQEMSTAKDELAALINVPPGTPFTLTPPTDADLKLPEWTLPLPQMEEMAFMQNPDLREQAYQTRIAVDDTKKEFIKLLPGINLTAGRNYDSNSFLMNNSWGQASAMVSWNLFTLLSAPDRIHFAHDNETLADRRRLALRMAVLAQVHVAWQQYDNAVRQFDRADALYKVESKIAAATAQRQENDAQSELERIGSDTSAIAAALRRYQALSLAQGALGRMEATLGVDPVSGDLHADTIQNLARQISARLDRPVVVVPEVATPKDPASAQAAPDNPPSAGPPAGSAPAAKPMASIEPPVRVALAGVNRVAGQ
jgi:outer membrane protein TolC